MKKIGLSDTEFDDIRSLLERDSCEIAWDIPFFEQSNLNPKGFIDKRISLCKKFDLEFLDCVGDNCSDYHTRQLRALYEGKDLREFITNYEIPSQSELAKDFLKMVVRKRNEKRK